VLGLSAAISGTNYEMTAETGSPCQLNFIGRQDLMTLLENESEVGMHAALWLSRELQDAYRDIHDLVLARSSSGKLARLLLSCAPRGIQESEELHPAFRYDPRRDGAAHRLIAGDRYTVIE
jgi:CRP-like cAMP-binding protein